jgi:hypothetical protein
LITAIGTAANTVRRRPITWPAAANAVP